MRGRIEAIGVHDLMRVAMVKRSTGRLLFFDEREDAELYFEEGRLVSVTSSALIGHACLQRALALMEGEFEFAWGMPPSAEGRTPKLHEAMLTALKEHYAARAGVPASSPEVSHSGVHRVVSKASQVPAAPGELGRATVEFSGRVLARTGAMTAHDAAFAALTVKQAELIGAALDEEDLLHFTISTPGKVLVSVLRPTGMQVAKLTPEADVEAMCELLAQ